MAFVHEKSYLVYNFNHVKSKPAIKFGGRNKQQPCKSMGGHPSRYNFLIIFFVALGSFTYGFNSAISGSVLGLASFLDYFRLNSDKGTAASLIGAINGLFAAGGVIGCLTIPSILDAFGRRNAIRLAALVCVVSAILQAASVHIAMLLVGRFFNGIAVGMVDVSVPIYQSEISPPKVRGRMVGSHGFLIVSGYAMAGWVGIGCFFVENDAVQWRLCLAIQILAPLLLLLGSPWMPESPRWLCARDHLDEARVVLGKLHPDQEDRDSDISFADAEFDQICRQIEIERTESKLSGWRRAFKQKSFRKRMLYGFFVQCIAQSTGVLVVNNYQILLYEGLGITGWTSLLLYACYNTLAAFMNWVNSIMLDHFGRIRIMTVGLICCSLSLCGFTAMVAQFVGTSNAIGNGFGVFFLYLFVFFYGGTMDASSYVYCAEIFPTSIRSQGVGFSVGGLFMMTLIYTQSAPTAFSTIGWKYYLIFIILPWVGVYCLVKYFPETAQQSLEEIAGLFGDEVVTVESTITGPLSKDESFGGVEKATEREQIA
ncbi:hypothetical protein Q7P37_010371 [Cladosporium fusiforme]